MKSRLVVVLEIVLACAGPVFSQRASFNIQDYGAKGDGTTINTLAIRQAIDACVKAGGGTVYVPAGQFVTGTVVLRSNMNLYLEAGAILKGSSDMADYKIDDADKSAVDPEFDKFFGQRYGLLWANNAENLSITGQGVIDGNGTHFMDMSKKRIVDDFDGQFTRQGKAYMYGDKEMGDGPVLPLDRPTMLFRCIHCKHLQIRDVFIKDSPEWTLHISNSEDVDISGITIRNPLMYANNDGIHCSSTSRIRIANCDISGGDDGIVVTGFGAKGISDGVTVSNCLLQSRSSGIRIGYGKNDVRNGVFQNLFIYGSNRGIGVYTRDGGSVENFSFSNIDIQTRLHTGHWWGHGEPIHVSAAPAEKDVRPGRIRNVRFSGITAHSESGILVWGVKDDPIQDLTLQDIHLTVLPTPLSATYGGNFDLRPVLEMPVAIFKHDMPGIFSRYANRLNLRNIDLQWAGAQPDYASHGIEVEYFEDLRIDGFRGGPARPANATVSLSHGRGAVIRNSDAQEGTAVFLAHNDVKEARLIDNDLSKAKKPADPALPRK